MAIDTRVAEDLEFGKRGFQTRDDFVTTQELGQDRLSGEWSQDVNQMAVEFNTTAETVTALEESTQQAKDDAEDSANSAEEFSEIAKSSANYQGDWVGGSSYDSGVSVSYEDLTYLSKIDNNTVEPTSETSTNEWYFSGRKDYTTSHISANHVAVDNDYLYADTTSGAFTVTLPTMPNENDRVAVFSTFKDNTLTIDGNGTDIVLKDETDTILEINSVIKIEFIFDGSVWRCA